MRVARQWFLRQRGLHLGGQAVEAAAHIRESGGNPEARVCERTNHRHGHWITTRSVSGSPLPSTCTLGVTCFRGRLSS